MRSTGASGWPVVQLAPQHVLCCCCKVEMFQHSGCIAARSSRMELNGPPTACRATLD
jgi:hypothetical protein